MRLFQPFRRFLRNGAGFGSKPRGNHPVGFSAIFRNAHLFLPLKALGSFGSELWAKVQEGFWNGSEYHQFWLLPSSI